MEEKELIQTIKNSAEPTILLFLTTFGLFTYLLGDIFYWTSTSSNSDFYSLLSHGYLLFFLPVFAFFKIKIIECTTGKKAAKLASVFILIFILIILTLSLQTLLTEEFSNLSAKDYVAANIISISYLTYIFCFLFLLFYSAYKSKFTNIHIKLLDYAFLVLGFLAIILTYLKSTSYETYFAIEKMGIISASLSISIRLTKTTIEIDQIIIKK